MALSVALGFIVVAIVLSQMKSGTGTLAKHLPDLQTNTGSSLPEESIRETAVENIDAISNDVNDSQDKKLPAKVQPPSQVAISESAVENRTLDVESPKGPLSPQFRRITQWKKDKTGRQLCEIRFNDIVDGLEGRILTVQLDNPQGDAFNAGSGLMIVVRTRGRDLVAVCDLQARIGDHVKVEFDDVEGASTPTVSEAGRMIDEILAERLK